MNTRIHFAVLLIVAIFVAGCQGQPLQPNDPAAAVATIAAKQSEVNSYHLALNGNVTFGFGGPPPTDLPQSSQVTATRIFSASVTAGGSVNSERNEFDIQGAAGGYAG